jgi:hypothetical protein
MVWLLFNSITPYPPYKGYTYLAKAVRWATRYIMFSGKYYR